MDAEVLGSRAVEANGRDTGRFVRLRALGMSFAIAAIGIAVLVLCGWALQIESLKSVLPQFVAMKVNTALGLALSGTSLLLLFPREAGAGRRTVAGALAILVTLIGAASLFEIVTSVNLGIDELFFSESADAVATSSPGRMAPSSAVSFMAIGLALALLDQKTRTGYRPAQLLALVAALFPAISIVGYLYGATALYGVLLGPNTHMALHTALGFLLLSGGVLLARPRSAIVGDFTGEGSGSDMARRFLPAVIGVPLFLGWLRLYGQSAGLFDAEAGVALYASANVIVFLIFVWMNARRLNREHDMRSRAEGQLRELNAELERRVSTRTAALESEVAERRKAEKRAGVLLEAAPDAMISVDQSGRILLCSHRVEAMFGYASAELLGRSINVLLPEQEQVGHTAHVFDFMKSPKARSMGAGADLYARHKDGSEFPVEVSLSPDTTEDGPVVIAAVRDISDRRGMELQLRQAQKMEAVGQLTGGMAHDFNNLLGVIIGNLDLLRDRGTVDPESETLAREALDAALRGADLTQRLLAFARRQPLQPRIVDLNDLVGSISRLLVRTLGENIEIGHELAEGTWPVIVDPAQLEASLVNIVNNARDAMPKGGLVMIATSNRYLDEDYASQHPGLVPGEYALIEVSDTGTGMPADVAERIFEPFFTTKEQGKGTGLGLSMVFGFMKQSSGHINVYSELGVGTTFRLYLPRAISEADAADARAAEASERGGNETVLVVEDNAGLRRVVVRQLNELGYRLLEAEDGPSALKILESETVDLLFTDIVMPGGMNGYDLAREAVARWPAMKAVLTSGFPEAKLNGNGGPPINMRLLTKPYRKADLARVLREVLED